MALGGITLIEAASLEAHLSSWIDPITRLGTRLPFTDLRTLEDALSKAFAAIAQTTTQTSHLLILSAHGVERTGTTLSVGHMQVDPWMAARRFEALPENVVVFLSACWGAYLGPVGAIRRHPKTQPVIVGPVVQINSSQNALLLRSLVEAIETPNGPVEDAVWKVAQHYNTRWASVFPRISPIQAVRTSGASLVDIHNVLSTPEEKRALRLLALHRDGRGAEFAILWDGKNVFRAPEDDLRRAGVDTSDIDCVFRVPCKLIDHQEELQVRRLDITGKAKRAPPGAVLPFTYRYSHCRTPDGRSELAFQIPPSSHPTCRACAWSNVTWVRHIGAGTDTKVLSMACTRDSCPELAEPVPDQ